jgi:formylglycine-generating enzyme required for sulfatase activity
VVSLASQEQQESLQNIDEKPEKQIRLKQILLQNDSESPRLQGQEQEQDTESAVSVTTMLSIPGGQFVMGSTGFSNVETPAHTVTIQPFQLGETEVTWAQYQGCIDSGACSNNAYDQGWGKANRPVINVSWNDVQRYIQWLNKKTGQRFRLASEAEWEYAARAVVGKGDREVDINSNKNYFWGDNIGENNANCDGCGSQWDDKKTAPVASFSANAIGLYDMHGNAWEWVQDCWHDNYKGAPTNGDAWEVVLQDSAKLQRAFKMQDASIIPEKSTIQEQCRRRVLRGGSWNNVRGYLRSAYRSADSAENTYFNFGFRLAHD